MIQYASVCKRQFSKKFFKEHWIFDIQHLLKRTRWYKIRLPIRLGVPMCNEDITRSYQHFYSYNSLCYHHQKQLHPKKLSVSQKVYLDNHLRQYNKDRLFILLAQSLISLLANIELPLTHFTLHFQKLLQGKKNQQQYSISLQSALDIMLARISSNFPERVLISISQVVLLARPKEDDKNTYD